MAKKMGEYMMNWLQSTDFAILDWIAENLRCAFLDAFFPYFTFLGNGGWFFILTAVVLLCFKRTRKVGLAIGLALIFGLIFGNLTLKPLVARIRPFDARPCIELIISKPSEFSFPSGHTLAAFETATAIFMFNKKWGTYALIFAAVMGFSRLYLYVHYPSDVIAGAILGSLFGFVAAVIIRRIFKKAE